MGCAKRLAAVTLAAVCAALVLSSSPGLAEIKVIDWAIHPGTGHWYGLIADVPTGAAPQGVTWTDAEDFAASALGVHLVTIDSLDENQWVFDRFIGQENRCLWIGLNDAAQDDDYRWIADNSPLAISAPWYPGEPNDYLTGGQDYVMMLSGAWSGSGLWNDNIAGVTVFPYGPSPAVMGLAEDVVPEPSALLGLAGLLGLAVSAFRPRKK